MSIHRRNFIKALGVAPISASLSFSSVAHVNKMTVNLEHTMVKEKWVSAAALTSSNSLTWFDVNPHSNPHSKSAMTLATDFRGHGICLKPVETHQVLMMARRPGHYGLIADIKTGQKVAEFETQAPYEFQGHACFSADGKKIFTSEMINDAASPEKNGQGRIGVRDAQSRERMGDLDSYGIEPHEIRLMPDHRTLVIANGGLCPESEEQAPFHKAQSQQAQSQQAQSPADVMQSSLVFIDSISGELIEQCVLDESKASVRHVSVSSDGTVVVALQVQRQALNDTLARPLAAIKRPGAKLTYLDAPEALWLGAKDYMGSVAIWEDGAIWKDGAEWKKNSPVVSGIKIAGMTSPRGSFASFWDVTSGGFLGYYALYDVCGISISHEYQSFVLTNSAGDMHFIDPISLKEHRYLRQKNDHVRWDNHLSLPVF